MTKFVTSLPHRKQMEINSRKRKLSTETAFLPQLKCYVNENIQNQRSEKKMKEIYSKRTFHRS